MAIGKHHPENDDPTPFVVLLVCVALAVLAATIASVHDSNSRSTLVARSDILYPVGK